MRDDVDTLRRFNRYFTRRMGVLDDRFLGRDRSVGAARLVFEIGPHGETVGGLRSRLGLDSGYMSRLLRDLEKDGLAEITVDQTDRRRRKVTLTATGVEEWQTLDRLSDDLAGEILRPLDQRLRARLAETLTIAERLMSVPSITYDIVDAAGEEAIGMVNDYFSELDRRFPDGFDPGGAPMLDTPSLSPPLGRFLIARSGANPVACGGVTTLEDGLGEIKRMWVVDAWRGYGIGPRLLAELELHGVELGHTRMRLDTNPTLTEAISMYRRAGYSPIARYNDNPYAGQWYEKSLTNAVASQVGPSGKARSDSH